MVGRKTLSEIKRRVINTLKGPLKKKVFFMHIPKCAGTSLKKAIKNQYLTLDYRKDTAIFDFSEKQLSSTVNNFISAPPLLSLPFSSAIRTPQIILNYAMADQKVKYISGHVPFCDIAYQAYSHDFLFVTLLRDPVERFISEYTYNKFHAGTHQKDTTSMPIEEYIETERGIAQGGQYVLWLGGRVNGEEYFSVESIKRAKDNIDKFDVIGCIENLPKFYTQYEQKIGKPLIIQKENTNPKPKSYKISESTRQKIEQLCARDIEIYNYIKAKP